MPDMTKRERIAHAVHGEATDTLPYAFWTHLPGVDLDAQRLAEETCAFYRAYDVDLVKTMSNGMYAIEDYGCEIDYSAIASGGVAVLRRGPIASGEDWRRIEPLGLNAPALARELRSLQLVLKGLKGENVPVIFTVFSPLTTASKLCGGRLAQHVRDGCGDQLKRALEAITQTTAALVKAAVAMGADGVYFATQWADRAKASEDFYREYGVPYDLRVLSASAGTCDVLHAHGDAILFDVLKHYPVDIFNWHVFESEPSVEVGSRETGRCVMGGLRRGDITAGNRQAIDRQIRVCLEKLRGRGHILSPGCVVRYPLNGETLAYIRQAKERLEREVLGR